jgi:PAS domain S-box-containing protein
MNSKKTYTIFAGVLFTFALLLLSVNYIIVFNKNSTIEDINFVFMLVNISTIAGFFILLFFTYKVYKYKKFIEEQNRELVEIQHNSDLGQKIANIGIWKYDYISKKLEWTSGIDNILDVPKDQEVEHSFDAFLKCVYVDDRERVKSEYKNAIENKKDYFLEHRIITKSQTLKYVEQRCQNFFENGKIVKSVGTLLDISERKRLEKSLKKSNANLENRVENKITELEKSKVLFETIFNTVKDGVAIIDLESNFLLVNKAYESMVKYDKDELYKLSCVELTDSSMREESDIALKMVVTKGYYGGISKQLITKDETTVDVKVDLILMPDRKTILLVSKDITRQNRYEKELALQEQQLLQQSRLAQMGEMLSMIAHQWRQPLAAISSTSTSLELKATLGKADSQTVLKLTNKISEYAQHLSSTINDFRDFFKVDKKESMSSYDDIVKSILNIVEASIESSNILIVQELNNKNKFMTYPNEIKQVVLNLLKNAEDILVEKRIEHPFIKIKTYEENGKYILEVHDNAGGIPEDIVDKIFDPYFSTKLEKNGTGLGLYMSKIIVEEHCKGSLSVSNYKDGALFKMIL